MNPPLALHREATAVVAFTIDKYGLSSLFSLGKLMGAAGITGSGFIVSAAVAAVQHRWWCSVCQDFRITGGLR